MTQSLYVANTLIHRAKNDYTNLTHLKLQKLVYFVYARFLALANKPLFADRFEAWKLGPVLSGLYHIFKNYDNANITELVPSIIDGKILILIEEGDFGKAFNDVWSKYGYYQARDLVNLTHEEGSAWSIAVVNNVFGGFLNDEYIRKDGERWFSSH